MASNMISTAVATPKITESSPARDLGLSANAPQFDQVMNLVQPKVMQEAVKAYEAHTEPRKVKDGQEAAPQKIERSAQAAPSEAVQETESDVQASGEAAVVSGPILDEGQRAKLLRIISQLSQEDLLTVTEWRGDLSLHAGALDTHLDLANLPKVEGISTSDMMALLNGFKQLNLDSNPLPTLDGPHVAQWLEAQWEVNKAHHAPRFAMMPLIAQQQAQQATPTNPISMMGMEAVVRPSEVMPALNLLKLSQGQKDGILRQVAQGFRSQKNGTQSVQIRLHPEELGAVRLKVEVQGQEVRLFYSAESAAVSDLIAQNLDELKAMLLDQDYTLTEANHFQDQHNGEDRGAQGDDGEDYGTDDRPNLMKRPKSEPRLSPLPGRFRATV